MEIVLALEAFWLRGGRRLLHGSLALVAPASLGVFMGCFLCCELWQTGRGFKCGCPLKLGAWLLTRA
jgi:hypothetical protein